jgi:hypothetical protein
MWQFFRQLCGRDPLSHRMKALRDIDRCHARLSAILRQSIWDDTFDQQRLELERVIDDFHERLKSAVTYSDWWDMEQEALRGASGTKR